MQRDEDGLSVPRLFLPRLSVHSSRGQFRQRENHGRTARRDPKDHRLPTSLRQGRRAVGVRVEKDETRSSRKTVSGRRVPTTTTTSTRSVDVDFATDPERRARRNRVRHDRVRHLRAGRTAQSLCRDAARVQEHQSDTRGSRSVHASIRRRASVDSAMRCPRPDARETSTETGPSSRTP